MAFHALPVPFFAGDVDAEASDGSVHVRPDHRPEVLQDQPQRVAPHSHVPEK